MPKPIEQPNITQKPALPNHEETHLPPLEEVLFRQWVIANKLDDEVKNPESAYDYRAFWKASNGALHSPAAKSHFPDTFKQHGHETFSVESQYSKGPQDGGMWIGPEHDVFLPQEPMMASHEVEHQSPVEQSLVGRVK